MPDVFLGGLGGGGGGGGGGLTIVAYESFTGNYPTVTGGSGGQSEINGYTAQRPSGPGERGTDGTLIMVNLLTGGYEGPPDLGVL